MTVRARSRLAMFAAATAVLMLAAVSSGAVALPGSSRPTGPPAASSTEGSIAAATPAPSTAATAGTSAPASMPPAASAASLAIALVPVVTPVSSIRAIGREQLAARFAAGDPRLLVSAVDLTALASSLGVVPGTAIRSAPADRILAAVAADPTTIGILRAADVTPDVRALRVDGRALFGAERVRSLADWPLVVAEDAAAATPAAVFDPAEAWTLVAGGDVMLDRAAYRQSVVLGKGPDFPWDGGMAAITGTTCCGAAGARLPVGRRTGDAGAVRTLMTAADVAIVNLEGPAPDAFTYHPGGLVFSFDPALLVGLRDAGIDVVSLANNHISNAGPAGVVQTVAHLDGIGVSHAGAGSDLTAARRPAIVSAAGLRVAVLAYDAIRPDLDATATGAGAAPLRIDLVTADIRAARAAGADVVIVMPHWGTEYTDAVTSIQRQEAAAMVAAGADAVIGSHSHWVGPVEMVDGRPVLYSLGDLVFQLTHDRRTMEGALADLTFVGRRLVQLDLHPTLILDGAQPNLLDPAGDGTQLLADVRRASAALPPR